MMGLKRLLTVPFLSCCMIAMGLTHADAQLMDYDIPAFDFPKGQFIDGVKRVPPVMPPMAMQSGHCKFNIQLDGAAQPKSVDVYYCTDYLFEASTRDAIAKWEFKSDLANSVMEQVMTFRLTDETGQIIAEAEDAAFHKHNIPDDAKDARLVYLLPPNGLGWEKLGEEIGYCCVTHSISQLGNPINVVIDGCSGDKMSLTANELVRNWVYDPAERGQKPVSVEGHEAVIKFYKIKRRGNFLRDVHGMTPIAGVNDKALDYCRKLS